MAELTALGSAPVLAKPYTKHALGIAVRAAIEGERGRAKNAGPLPNA
jgi:hypothetical protein